MGETARTGFMNEFALRIVGLGPTGFKFLNVDLNSD